MNPGAQGASLTEKKKGKRAAKKVNGEDQNGENHRSGSPSDDLDHSTSVNDKVSSKYVIYLHIFFPVT